MNLNELLQRAIQVRNKYSELEKKEINKERSTLNLMEGFVCDVGDLMKLVMAKEGIGNIDKVDEKLAHELSDCLWSILILADKYGIDLETSFKKTMDELNERIEVKLKM